METNEIQNFEENRKYIESVGKWMKFMAILMIISIGVLFLMAIILLITGGIMGDIPEAQEIENIPGMSALKIMPVFIIIVAGIMVIPTLYLLRASSAAKMVALGDSNEQVTEFLKNNKSYWKFMGIYTIVVIAISILFTIISAIVTAAAV